MPNFQTWLGATASQVSAEDRALRAWRRIQDKPSSITFYDPDTQAAISAGAQVVRLEYEDMSQSLRQNQASGETPRRFLIIFGVADHPTVADTDIQEGYRFKYLDKKYRVVDVIPTLGEVQAHAEVYDGTV